MKDSKYLEKQYGSSELEFEVEEKIREVTDAGADMADEETDEAAMVEELMEAGKISQRFVCGQELFRRGASRTTSTNT